jgi:hypothetical protein
MMNAATKVSWSRDLISVNGVATQDHGWLSEGSQPRQFTYRLCGELDRPDSMSGLWEREEADDPW